MKKVILAVCVLAIVGVVVYKFAGRQEAPQPPPAVGTATPASSATGQAKSIFYLFHDPSDQDAGCRRIYSFADRAESELSDKVEVKRPDVENEKSIVEQYEVRVLPTILVITPDGKVAERHEGEDGETVKRLEGMMARLKESAR